MEQSTARSNNPALEETVSILRNEGRRFAIVDHQTPTVSVADKEAILAQNAKIRRDFGDVSVVQSSLLAYDDQDGEHLLLYVHRGKIDFKRLRDNLGVPRKADLTFYKGELKSAIGLEQGAVSPFVPLIDRVDGIYFDRTLLSDAIYNPYGTHDLPVSTESSLIANLGYVYDALARNPELKSKLKVVNADDAENRHLNTTPLPADALWPIDEVRRLAGSLNVLDLEKLLDPKMSEIGFFRISEDDLTKTIPDRFNQILYPEWDMILWGSNLFFSGLHPKGDRLVYRKGEDVLLVRKDQTHVPDFWKNYFGLVLCFGYDLRPEGITNEDQAKTLPPNKIILQRSVKDQEGAYLSYPTYPGNSSVQASVTCSSGYLTYHQLLSLRKPQSGVINDAFKDTVAELVARTTYINNEYVRGQAKTLNQFNRWKDAFELILR